MDRNIMFILIFLVSVVLCVAVIAIVFPSSTLPHEERVCSTQYHYGVFIYGIGHDRVGIRMTEREYAHYCLGDQP